MHAFASFNEVFKSFSAPVAFGLLFAAGILLLLIAFLHWFIPFAVKGISTELRNQQKRKSAEGTECIDSFTKTHMQYHDKDPRTKAAEMN